MTPNLFKHRVLSFRSWLSRFHDCQRSYLLNSFDALSWDHDHCILSVSLMALIFALEPSHFLSAFPWFLDAEFHNSEVSNHRVSASAPSAWARAISHPGLYWNNNNNNVFIEKITYLVNYTNRFFLRIAKDNPNKNNKITNHSWIMSRSYLDHRFVIW